MRDRYCGEVGNEPECRIAAELFDYAVQQGTFPECSFLQYVPCDALRLFPKGASEELAQNGARREAVPQMLRWCAPHPLRFLDWR